MSPSCTASSINARRRPFGRRPIGRSLPRRFRMSTFWVVFFVGLFLGSSPAFAQPQNGPGRGSMRMSVVIVNPSETKTQTIPVKTYLPKEVTPDDVLNSGGLEIEFDTQNSIYYLHREGVELKPKETRTYQVEIKDVWIIPEERLDALRDQTEMTVQRLEGTEYYESAQKLAKTIYNSLDTIARTQNDETVSSKAHIGIYRNNLKILDQVKQDLEYLEKRIPPPASNPPVPEELEESKLKSDSPDKTTTWAIILFIIVFLGLLGGVFFFTWHARSKFTQEFSASSDFPSKKSSEETSPQDEKPSDSE